MALLREATGRGELRVATRSRTTAMAAASTGFLVFSLTGAHVGIAVTRPRVASDWVLPPKPRRGGRAKG
jgi:hypothetical protein